MKRRDFLQFLVYIVVLNSCNNDKGGRKSSGIKSCSDNDPFTSINDNHGHTVTIPISDINLEISTTYNFTGGDHGHALTLTISDIQTLKESGKITVESSATDHSHSVAITCNG